MSRAETIDALIATHGHETVLAAVRPMMSDARLERIDAVLAKRITSLTVVIENLYDPHNGAAAIRSVEAFGLSEVWAVESLNKMNVSGDVTIGAHKWVTVHRRQSAAQCAADLRERGFSLAATTPDASRPFDELDPATPWAVWFGNERDGLTDEAIALADERVSIPMLGFTRSFNLSVSVALIVRELAARRRAHLGCDGDLTDDLRDHLRARFAATGIRGLSEIIARHVSD